MPKITGIQNYVLALKVNPSSNAEGMRELTEDGGLLKDLKKTVEKARSDRDARVLDTDQFGGWLPRKDEQESLRCAGISRNTTKKDGKATVAWRYFLTSLTPDIGMFAGAARGRWRIEAMRNTLDAALGEDANRTIERPLRKTCPSCASGYARSSTTWTSAAGPPYA